MRNNQCATLKSSSCSRSGRFSTGVMAACNAILSALVGHAPLQCASVCVCVCQATTHGSTNKDTQGEGARMRRRATVVTVQSTVE